jgi:hypothetical protein
MQRDKLKKAIPSMIHQVGQEQFRVPKFSISVVCHTSQEILEGTIFLDVVESSRSLLQRVLDFFNAPNPFFPIRVSGTEQPILLRKDALSQVDVLQAMDPDETEMFGALTKRKAAILYLTSSQTVQVEIVLDLPDSYCRLLDLLSIGKPFLLALVGEKFSLFNYHRIYKIEEP